ncbi:MAG TPA: DUF4287 domain-containing protein [Candidatus Saccharimonadales bacterium]|nr:DUF4287 domain-containing protein [Candidatus Saccharimonadales bacterium]
MSFQAYLDNIKAKTGKTPEDFKKAVEEAGITLYDMKASEFIKFMKDNFDVGHGHSMAIWLVFKQNNWVPEKPNSKK